MAMHALTIAPLMNKCATDASAGGAVNEVFFWWERLVEHGPRFGYFPKACKSSIIVKSLELKSSKLSMEQVLASQWKERHILESH